MREHTYPVLMAGGAGTRFWPLSRRRRPKQVLSIADERPMIRATVDRLGDLAPIDNVLVVTGGDQVAALKEALPDVPAANFLLEPVPRNTAPCIGFAAVTALGRDPDALLLCLPSDHVIEPAEAFRETCRRALARADSARKLLTFGVEPDRPATGYGYIRGGAEVREGIRRVEEFVEKPDLATAEGYLADGRYLWNSGMFAWRAEVFLGEVGRHLPDLAEGLTRIAAEPARHVEVFPGLPSISVDYGVMEKTDLAEVVAAEFSWSDVGSLEALADLTPADAAENHARGELLAIDSHGLVAVAPTDHLVAALGVEDLAIVVTEDATLVCPRSRLEEVGEVVARLRPAGRGDLE